MVKMHWDCRLFTGLPPSSWLCRSWSQKGDLQWVWNQDRKAVWDHVGLSHCRHEGLVTVRDEARLRRGYNDDQSRQGHQCSETSLTGESRFHISTLWGFEPVSLVTGSKQVVHWTSETWREWSEIAGFPHYSINVNNIFLTLNTSTSRIVELNWQIYIQCLQWTSWEKVTVVPIHVKTEPILVAPPVLLFIQHDFFNRKNHVLKRKFLVTTGADINLLPD